MNRADRCLFVALAVHQCGGSRTTWGLRLPLKKEILANLGTVDLVSTDGHQVNVHLVHVQRNFTHCLGSVSVKKYLHRSSLNNLYGLQYLWKYSSGAAGMTSYYFKLAAVSLKKIIYKWLLSFWAVLWSRSNLDRLRLRFRLRITKFCFSKV